MWSGADQPQSWPPLSTSSPGDHLGQDDHDNHGDDDDDGGGSGAIKHGNGEELPDQQIHLVIVI